MVLCESEVRVSYEINPPNLDFVKCLVRVRFYENCVGAMGSVMPVVFYMSAIDKGLALETQLVPALVVNLLLIGLCLLKRMATKVTGIMHRKASYKTCGVLKGSDKKSFAAKSRQSTGQSVSSNGERKKSMTLLKAGALKA